MDRIFSFRQFRKWCNPEQCTNCWKKVSTIKCTERNCQAWAANPRIIKTEEMRGKSSGTGIAGAENMTAKR